MNLTVVLVGHVTSYSMSYRPWMSSPIFKLRLTKWTGSCSIRKSMLERPHYKQFLHNTISWQQQHIEETLAYAVPTCIIWLLRSVLLSSIEHELHVIKLVLVTVAFSSSRYCFIQTLTRYSRIHKRSKTVLKIEEICTCD